MLGATVQNVIVRATSSCVPLLWTAVKVIKEPRNATSSSETTLLPFALSHSIFSLRDINNRLAPVFTALTDCKSCVNVHSEQHMWDREVRSIAFPKFPSERRSQWQWPHQCSLLGCSHVLWDCKHRRPVAVQSLRPQDTNQRGFSETSVNQITTTIKKDCYCTKVAWNLFWELLRTYSSAVPCWLACSCTCRNVIGLQQIYTATLPGYLYLCEQIPTGNDSNIFI
jgi:hypothetical protein